MAPTQQTFLPITELSAYQSKWTIKARVTNKAPVRMFSKGTNQGQVFHVDLLDAMGGEIRASFFNQAVHKYGNMLEKGKCFTFSHGSIKIANRQYNTCNHRYELSFDKDAVIEPVQDDSSIQAIQFNFVSLNTVGARSLPATVDICGIITSFRPTQPVTGKDGTEFLKREITVADDSATSMSVTLWGDRAKQEDSVFDGHPIVALKAVLVKEWNDSRSGSVLQSGEVRFKPDMPEAKRVQQWWSQGGSSQELVQLSALGGAGGAEGGRGRKATQTNLAGLRSAVERLGDQPEIYSVVARLALIQTRKQGEPQPLHYMACQESRDGPNGRPMTCNKRVDAQNFCLTCNRAGKVAPRVTMRCRFVDFEDQAWLTSFHEAATKIVGMTGEEVRELELDAVQKGEAGREELDATIRKMYFAKPMQITVRGKMGSYNGESRPDVAIIDARPVSHGEHGRQMLKEIHDLLSQPAQAGA